MFQIRRESCDEGEISATSHTSNASEPADAGLANEAVSAFMLDPRWRLRFAPFDPEAAWNTLQAMDETAIAFTARSPDDGLSGGDRVDLDMPYCCHEVC